MSSLSLSQILRLVVCHIDVFNAVLRDRPGCPLCLCLRSSGWSCVTSTSSMPSCVTVLRPSSSTRCRSSLSSPPSSAAPPPTVSPRVRHPLRVHLLLNPSPHLNPLLSSLPPSFLCFYSLFTYTTLSSVEDAVSCTLSLCGCDCACI